MNSKFKLELRALSDEQFAQWSGMLIAKRNLYSIDDLLSDINAQRLSFKTTTFQYLMLLKENDQNKYILDKIDATFNIPINQYLSNSLRGKIVDSCALLNAAHLIIKELKNVCREYILEIESRNPKIVAHTRFY